ncbi:trigger factor-like protein TIG, Chloroplastic [Cryptomeria japonica]|uniref:trigger factor-like protein TIG, Chloroplastic n=1 Tax=Cryptomeria japonica TaxID=3369 RepID=UPI0027DA5ED0|nr:trigger factor-like protein TIG, Chloroplastic [Cryptomeria japonica]
MTGFHLDTEETSHLVPGFRDSLLGLETGETRSFELTFPSTWKQKELQGVRARFTVECKEMFYRILPVLDDTLADKLITGCSTLDQVRETILKKHKEMEELRKIQATQQAVLQELSKVVKMDIPHSLLEEQGRNMYGAKLIQLQTTMKLTEEQIFTLSSAKAVNNYLLSQKEKIKEAVKQSLAIEEIFKLENLQYSEEELEKEVEKTVEEFKSYKHEFDRDRITEQAAEFLEGSQVLEWLMEQTDITYVTEDT